MHRCESIRSWWIDAGLGLASLAILLLLRDSLLSVSAFEGSLLNAWQMPVVCLAAVTFWTLLAYRLILRMDQSYAGPYRQRWVHAIGRLLREDAGSASVSFILTLPIFLTVLAVIVQSALLVNASLVVNYAAFASARTAITNTDTKQPRRAAALVLSGISPKGLSSGSTESDARYIQRTLQRSGVSLPSTFTQRYGYALAATTVSPSDRVPTVLGGRSITVKVKYQFQLTVPGAAVILSPARSSVAGVQGRFVTIPAQCILQASPGRMNPGAVGGLVMSPSLEPQATRL